MMSGVIERVMIGSDCDLNPSVLFYGILKFSPT